MIIAPAELSLEEVRERFSWARRNGFSTWLWPDITVDDWRTVMVHIFHATRDVLAGKLHRIPDCNAHALGLAGYTSGMGPLLGYWIETGAVQAEEPAEHILRLHLHHNRARNQTLASHARSVVERLTSMGIPIVLFKGMHTAFAYFPAPDARPMSDIDIYIAPAHTPAAERTLAEMGFEPNRQFRGPHGYDWKYPNIRRLPVTLLHIHRDDPWGLDVQSSLNRHLATGSVVMLDRLLGACSRDWSLSPAASVPAQPLLALHLAAHISETFHNVTLLRLCELILVLRQDCASGDLRWDDFLEGARTIGGGHFVYPALHLCEQLAPGTIPAEVLRACRAGAPVQLLSLLASHSPATVQPLGRHSLRERFMWVDSLRGVAGQVRTELGLDGRKSFGRALYDGGTKLWALGRRRLTA
ncbi:MAG TPA: nucleotidyltransferase family protein [Rhizomicrobium sp.]|jgi:hypothetical protein